MPPTTPTETAATEPVSGSPASSVAVAQPADRVGQGHVRAGDRGGPGAAVGLQHVAVEHDGVLAERLVVDDRAQAAADQPADLVGPAADPALDRLPVVAGVGGPRAASRTRWSPSPDPSPCASAARPAVTLAATSTRVWPYSTSTEPSACSSQPRVNRTSRSWSWVRPSARVVMRTTLFASSVRRRQQADRPVAPGVASEIGPSKCGVASASTSSGSCQGGMWVSTTAPTPACWPASAACAAGQVQPGRVVRAGP